MTWILLRGLTREARHWGSFAQTLADGLVDRAGNSAADSEANSEAKPDSLADDVHAIDLPGNGIEHAMMSPVSVSAMVAFVRSRARACGARAPYRLLALSLGGMVATAWAQGHPAEVDRLVLINTSMRPFGWPHQRLRWQVWPRVVQVLRHWHDGPRCELAIHRLTCADATHLDDDLRLWTAIRAGAPVSRMSALRQLLAAARFSAADAAPRCPTLILSSAADRLVAAACSAALARHWNCAHAVHPQAGHDLPHDDPEWVVRHVAAWNAACERDGITAPTRARNVPDVHSRQTRKWS